MKRGLALLMALVVSVALLVGCSGRNGGDPGAGGSVADKIYTATNPVIGESVKAVPPGSTTKCLADRLDSASKSAPKLGVERTWPTEPRGSQWVERFEFKDGSSLLLVESLGSDGGPVLDSVEISRP